MDSSHFEDITSSNRKRKAPDSIMVTCKRTKFMAKYYQQIFSMLDSVIFYIAKHPKTATLYLKMVKTCKYFFFKNPIIIIDCLYTRYGKWGVNEKPLSLTKYNCKYWITDNIIASASEFVDKNIFSPIIPKLYQCDVKYLSLLDQIISFNDLSLLISSAEFINFGKLDLLDLIKYNCKYWITDEVQDTCKNIFSPIIPKLYQCDAKRLSLSYQIISFNDLSLLISSAEKIHLNNVIVKNCDSVIPLEDIVAIAVNAKKMFVHQLQITSKTMKELTKLSHFLKLDDLNLQNLCEVFDIDAFYSYMKKNQHTKFSIGFDPLISDAFKNRLEAIVDEILETNEFDYRPPEINFTGLDSQKRGKLLRIFYSH